MTLVYLSGTHIVTMRHHEDTGFGLRQRYRGEKERVDENRGEKEKVGESREEREKVEGSMEENVAFGSREVRERVEERMEENASQSREADPKDLEAPTEVEAVDLRPKEAGAVPRTVVDGICLITA